MSYEQNDEYCECTGGLHPKGSSWCLRCKACGKPQAKCPEYGDGTPGCQAARPLGLQFELSSASDPLLGKPWTPPLLGKPWTPPQGIHQAYATLVSNMLYGSAFYQSYDVRDRVVDPRLQEMADAEATIHDEGWTKMDDLQFRRFCESGFGE